MPFEALRVMLPMITLLTLALVTKRAHTAVPHENRRSGVICR